MLEFWLVNSDPWHVPDEHSVIVEVLRDNDGIKLINGKPRPPINPPSINGIYWRVLTSPPHPLDCTIVRVG